MPTKHHHVHALKKRDYYIQRLGSSLHNEGSVYIHFTQLSQHHISTESRHGLRGEIGANLFEQKWMMKTTP
jgi:hypothetical protein